jgi:hypothetical protein
VSVIFAINLIPTPLNASSAQSTQPYSGTPSSLPSYYSPSLHPPPHPLQHHPPNLLLLRPHPLLHTPLKIPPLSQIHIPTFLSLRPLPNSNQNSPPHHKKPILLTSSTHHYPLPSPLIHPYPSLSTANRILSTHRGTINPKKIFYLTVFMEDFHRAVCCCEI